MGDLQNYGPFLGPLNTRCRIILRTQKGTIILAATHIELDRDGPSPDGSPFSYFAHCS